MQVDGKFASICAWKLHRHPVPKPSDHVSQWYEHNEQPFRGEIAVEGVPPVSVFQQPAGKCAKEGGSVAVSCTHVYPICWKERRFVRPGTDADIPGQTSVFGSREPATKERLEE